MSSTQAHAIARGTIKFDGNGKHNGNASEHQARTPVVLTANARTILEKRYLRRGADGKPAETIEEMFARVARVVAEPDANYGEDARSRTEEFYDLLTTLRFFPNSPTFTGAGTPLGQLAACFVIPIKDDMGRDPAGIFSTLRVAALIQQTGGGNGFSFSRLRPKGDHVATSAGVATGPVGFLRVYDKAFGEIAQGGTRRGANMGVLRVDHPDIQDFVRSKEVEGDISNFNISVALTDAFMDAVENDEDFELVNPRDGKVWRTILARELLNDIVRHAHHNGEPGALFIDAANRSNPVPHLYELEATNPCVTGETLIYTAEGLRRADELAANDQPLQVVVDGRFGTDPLLPASPVLSTGIKEVYRLATREGYEVRLTADHKVMTEHGWTPARDLKPGDQVHILNRKGSFGRGGSLEEGRVLGWLIGDGTISAIRAVLSFFGEEKRELAPLFAQSVTGIVEHGERPRAYPVGIIDIPDRDEARVASERLRTWAAGHGLTEDKFHVPPAVFVGSAEMQRGFIQALFTADGHVNDGGEKGCSVRLASSHLGLLKDVQRLLLNFGVVSRIYEERRPSGYRPMPDGHGGRKEYPHQSQHELALSKTNLDRFAQELGFLTEAKQSRLLAYLSRMKRGTYRELFTATVRSVELDGREPVYDLQQPETHSFIANGLVVHNCGEQWLGPYENCCLGSVNLAQHVTADGKVDWNQLRESIVSATRFLDNVVDANKYVPAVPQLQEAACQCRRIGLGIMGLGDLMYRLGVRYGAPEGEDLAGQVMEFVRYHTMTTSIDLARMRGAFPAIQGSIYDPENLKWTPPQPITPFVHDFGRPALNWSEIVDGIKQHGIRNAAQTTIAPTGTIATVAGVESYGCEPVFALAYTRHVNDQGKDLQLNYFSPLFEQALKNTGLDEAGCNQILDQVLLTGSCQPVKEVPAKLRHAFVVTSDIAPIEHVRMQAAMQAFVDNSLSKTINFPETATVEDVKAAYLTAWKLGCKGITVYVAGTRQQVVLETKQTALKRGSNGATPETAGQLALPQMAPLHKKPRPRALHGATYEISTPLGKAFITVNRNGDDQPFEAFCNVGKAGSDTAAVSEAIGRLISLCLRLPSPMTPTERLEEIAEQLAGIGGGRPMGFGPQRVRSLPDGIAQVLAQDLGQVPAAHVETTEIKGTPLFKIGDLCPSCGEAAFVAEEGCRRCHSCGYSEC
ncbi:MAG: ribonucleotide reductase N-terminal alpha domain-containing protein [Anaerolineae bacterium]